jgi:hypothetical protein
MEKNNSNRGCYCGALDKEFLDKNNIPEGYCGICERCGKPGHTRHYPGSVPYTGSWCDKCFKTEGYLYWAKLVLIWIGIPVLIIFLVKLI